MSDRFFIGSSNCAVLIVFSDKGLYCPQGNFYIDPWAGVDFAVITHAHSDHARAGSRHYLCHNDTLPLLQYRLGGHYSYQAIGWNQPILVNGIKISLHPAGHIIGSSQVRLEYKGEVWVVSGDYKLEYDGLCAPWEPIACHTFITESTFGLPIFRWQSQAIVYASIRNWVMENNQCGNSSILFAYSLGKAQRLLTALAPLGFPIFVHGAIFNIHQTLVNAGWQLPEVEKVPSDRILQKNVIVIAPPSVEGNTWLERFAPFSVAHCSGWMQIRGNARRRNADRGFVLSDHCDWPSLLTAVKATGAQQVFVTHGYTAVFSRYLNEMGINSNEVSTNFGQAPDIDAI